MNNEEEYLKRIENLEKQIERSKKQKNYLKKNISLLVSNYFLGANLKNSLSKLFNEVPDQLTRETLAEVVAAVIKRFSRIWILGLLFALIPIIQTIILHKQSTLIREQNNRVAEQSELLEASRRNSMVILMSELMNVIDDELRSNSDRYLSPQTIGRIAGLSNSLKPYKFLVNDSLTEEPYSPERGQLLYFIINSSIAKRTLDKIYELSNFSRSDLRNTNLEKAYLKGVNLEEANLSNTNLIEANLSHAKLNGAIISNSDCYLADFSFTQLVSSDISNSDLRNVNFLGTRFSIDFDREMKDVYVEFLRQNGYDPKGSNKAVNIHYSNKYYELAVLDSSIVSKPKWEELWNIIKTHGLNDIKENYIIDTIDINIDSRGLRFMVKEAKD